MIKFILDYSPLFLCDKKKDCGKGPCGCLSQLPCKSSCNHTYSKDHYKNKKSVDLFDKTKKIFDGMSEEDRLTMFQFMETFNFASAGPGTVIFVEKILEEE